MKKEIILRASELCSTVGLPVGGNINNPEQIEYKKESIFLKLSFFKKINTEIEKAQFNKEA